MTKLQEGQCGMCAHFGEDHPENGNLVQMRINGEGPDDYIDQCGHPSHAGLQLKVSIISGCEGFKSAHAA